jgi:hypothetical protein
MVANNARTAGQENPREDADIEAEPVLMQKAIFGGELDIAQADIGASPNRAIEAGRHRRGQLKIRRGAVVEINATCSGRAVARRGAVGEGVDFEVLIAGRLGSSET